MPRPTQSSRIRTSILWVILLGVVLVPLLIAALNPLQSSRNAAYIVASLAGILALGLLLVQPLLAAGYLPGLSAGKLRRLHRWIGSGLVIAVALHIGGLYITSPPDALDALLLVSPTPFSVYGVLAMWGLVLTALLVALRRHLPIRLSLWRIIHNLLAAIVVIATVVHALMIEGTMGQVSKIVLCVAVIGATATALIHLRVIKPLSKKRQ